MVLINAAGCASPNPNDPAASSMIECVRNSPSAKPYLAKLQLSTLQNWNEPDNKDPEGFATIEFSIFRSGELAGTPRILRASSAEMAESAISALISTSPFAPVPTAALCLADTPIHATFTTPGE
jgi:hypothetical protein